jgi:predicted NodU family carbamoyl transferase
MPSGRFVEDSQAGNPLRERVFSTAGDRIADYVYMNSEIWMLVLGLSGNFSREDSDLIPGLPEYALHDAAACLIKDGELIAAIEEERLNRIKQTTKFPMNSIRACLEKANLTTKDIDAVSYYFLETGVDSMLNVLYVQNCQVSTRYSRQLIKDRLREGLSWELPDEKLFYTPHHDAHAMSTFRRSGMDEALVVVMDAMGDDSSGTIYRADRGTLEVLEKFSKPKSLGILYLCGTRHLGYRFGDEYKVMGLAPYGDPQAYRNLFESIYTLEEKGDYSLTSGSITAEYESVNYAAFINGLQPRRKGDNLTQQHMDFAASLQNTLETIVLHVLNYWSRSTGISNLCFCGGVAHNSSLNGVILRSRLFSDVFVHPASHDAGAAEGAALTVEYQFSESPRPRSRLVSASVGPTLGSESDIADMLHCWNSLIAVELQDDIVETAAGLLAEGYVLGWAQGASEFGPRALGNRSIIADPRPKENQTRINSMVKKRESFRPFAPVVTPEAASTYFEIPKTRANYDFMSFVVKVREDRCAELGAVTHVDRTARLQIINPATNERFYRLVQRFGEITGTPVLLNTSFNNNAEPIVQTVHDVVTTFLTTDLDFLVVEKFVIHKRMAPHLALDDMIVRFRPVTRISKVARSTPTGEMIIDREIYLDYRTGRRAVLSPAAYTILNKVDGVTSLASLAAPDGLNSDIRAEFYALWQERYFTLTPK